MAPITSSFILDIEEAVFGRIRTVMGPNSTTYPTPPWLQVKKVGRTGGRPSMRVTSEENPHVFMEYLAGGGLRYEVGSGSRLPSASRELWNVYAVMNLTPEFMEMVDREIDDFQAYALAAADMLMRRLLLLLVDFNPNVVDGLLGYLTNGQRVNGWGLVATARGDLAIDYRALIRYEVLTERN
jgi:hypothetical protein